MGQEERWNQFAVTGKIMDYLEYKRCAGEERNSTAEGSEEHGRDGDAHGDDIDSIPSEGV